MKRWIASLMISVLTSLSAPALAHPQVLDSQLVFTYPFGTELRQTLEAQEEETIHIFSYGSLINRQSAARTLSEESLATREPAIAIGVKRVFSYDPESTSRGEPENPLERGMLNVIYTGNPDDQINGVVVEMQLEDAVALCKREIGYDLVPVTIVDWKNGGNPRQAYTFRAPEGAQHNGHKLVKNDIYPRPEYYSLVMEGAHEYGEDFVHTFLKTTYLADGERNICEWNGANC